jgi:mannose-6-phosphate isomerase
MKIPAHKKTSKSEVMSHLEDYLKEHNLPVKDKNIDKPWGGYLVIDDSVAQDFVRHFFDESVLERVQDATISPKILLVEPKKRLSWQVHERRSEVWKVVDGPVGVVQSETDEHPVEHVVIQIEERIELYQGTRHRLVGLEDWGVVAEIWIHTDPNNPSDEDDIVRLQDDYSR